MVQVIVLAATIGLILVGRSRWGLMKDRRKNPPRY
jgi:hypothetical protein